MSRTAYISSIEYYLPEKTLTNEQINIEHPEWAVDKISAKTGIFTRHLADENEFSSDLGFKAASKLLVKNKEFKDKIDYLIFCTQTPDYLIPATACLLQDMLGLNKNIGAIDINMGCSGFVYGLSYANGLICSEQAKNVLLVTSETYSKFINPLDKNNKTIFGDGASATLITASSNQNLKGAIKKFDFFTDGGEYDKLIVKNSGLKFRDNEYMDILNNEGGFIRNDGSLFMDGRAIFQFVCFQVPLNIELLLKKNNLKIEEIDLFIFHQSNAYMINFMRKICKIPEHKFFVHLEDYANTVSSTIPIALNEAIEQNKIKKGMKVLLTGYGVGLSVASTILEY